MDVDRCFWSGRRVCVTGGTGFLGWHIVTQLLALGARVRVGALPLARPHPIQEAKEVEFVPGDIRDAAAVRSAVGGCDTIFHTAGIVAVSGPGMKLMMPVHLDGTRNVLKAADAEARIVHTSSVVAVGGSRRGEVLNEDSPFPFRRRLLPYVKAKRDAEAIALSAAAAGRDVVVTNPSYLVGPEDYENSVMGRYCVRFWKGIAPVLPPGGLNLVDVRDVATGHLLAAQGGASGRRYILGGENHTYRTFTKLLAESAGLRPRALLPLPLWALISFAALAECRAWLKRREPYPSLGHARLNRHAWFSLSDRAKAELGYAPRPLSVTLADAFAWHRQRHTFKSRGLRRWLMRPAA